MSSKYKSKVLSFFYFGISYPPYRGTTSAPQSTSPSASGSVKAALLFPWCTPPFCWTCGGVQTEHWPSTLPTPTTATPWMISWFLPSLHGRQVSLLSYNIVNFICIDCFFEGTCTSGTRSIQTYNALFTHLLYLMNQCFPYN